MAETPARSGRGRPLTTRTRSSLFSLRLEKTETMLKIGKLKLRGKTDDLPQDWWFASTAIPLLAATIGPFANVLSIAALVSKWRVNLPNNGQLPEGTDNAGVDIPDPRWEIVLNAISLGCGFFGNVCLLLNFTRRIRYIVALPLTIISWYFATGILTGIIVAMNAHDPPIRPGQTYSQGFWYAIIASCLYMFGSMILMINMLGYFLGHYPQHFDLDDDQRTLILQTMMFFFWLAGGAGVFSKVCGFSYADALYFCDVTVLTVGFGDLVPPNDTGRGLIFPYSVFGIIFLGLMINSIRKFTVGLSKVNIIKRHQLRDRERTVSRSVTSEKELRERLGLPPPRDSDVPRPSSAQKSSAARRASLERYGHFRIHGRTITFREHKMKGAGRRTSAGRVHKSKAHTNNRAILRERASRRTSRTRYTSRHKKLILLREDKDRFDTMRQIQANTTKFKQFYALSISVGAFGILWCVGALVFMFAERRIQNLSYFEALYFCYVSLLTVGYGDFSPKSNAGKPFFVVWSLIAVPTMTFLVSDLSDTVVSAINRGTFTLADWTVMPKAGVYHDFLERHPGAKDWLERKIKEREAKNRIEHGFGLQDPDEEAGANESGGGDSPGEDGYGSTLENLADAPAIMTDHELARRLALAIKRTAKDLRLPRPKKYSYEEWVEFTRLIRFSSKSPDEVEKDEDQEGLMDWDWIGEDSPMLADVSESEWVLDRLCESLNRYTRRQDREARELEHHRHIQRQREPDSAIAVDSPIQANENSKTHLRRQHSAQIYPYPAHVGPRSLALRNSRSLSPEFQRGFHETVRRIPKDSAKDEKPQFSDEEHGEHDEKEEKEEKRENVKDTPNSESGAEGS